MAGESLTLHHIQTLIFHANAPKSPYKYHFTPKTADFSTTHNIPLLHIFYTYVTLLSYKYYTVFVSVYTKTHDHIIIMKSKTKYENRKIQVKVLQNKFQRLHPFKLFTISRIKPNVLFSRE